MASRERTWLGLLARTAIWILIPLSGYWVADRYEIFGIGEREDGMEPAYPRGCYVVVDQKVERYWGGDVVLVHSPTYPELRVGKLAAVPGDKIEIGAKGLLINGGTVFRNEEFMYATVPEEVVVEGRVPEGSFLFFNDNIHSIRPDSSAWGFIPQDWFLGKVVRRWPW